MCLIFQVMSSPHPQNKLTERRADMEIMYCRETGRADLHNMNAKLSPKDRACTSYKCSMNTQRMLSFCLSCNAKGKQEIAKQ